MNAALPAAVGGVAHRRVEHSVLSSAPPGHWLQSSCQCSLPAVPLA